MKTQYPLVLNALHEMQGSLLYAARKDVLASAEQIITHLEGLLNEVIEDRNNQRIRAEAAEAALKDAQEQEPVLVAWIDRGDNYVAVADDVAEKISAKGVELHPLYALPVPTAPAAHVLGANDQLATLMRFYQVSDIPSLALAQAKHVERLQAKLPAMRDDMPRNPRGA